LREAIKESSRIVAGHGSDDIGRSLVTFKLRLWPLARYNRHAFRRELRAKIHAVSEVISAISFEVAVLELGKDKRGAGDVADFAGAGGDVLEGAPAAGEQGEPAFAQVAQGTLDGVSGAGIDVQFKAAGGCLTGIGMPLPAPSYPGSARVGGPAAAAGYSARKAWARAAVRSCTIGEHHDHLVQVAVRRSPRDAMVTRQGVRGGAVAEPPQRSTACQSRSARCSP
jgi:hypothetical protein